MKLTLLILCNLLTLAATRAQEIDFALEPASPAPVDAVRLTITRDFPTPCYATTAGFHRNGHTFEVQLNSTSTGGICPAVIAPQSATVNLGRLEAGTYEVAWVWSGIPGSKSIEGTFSFQVLPALRLSGSNPVELRFHSAANAGYQARWSPDLVRWFDLGPPVPGTGEEIVIQDPGPITTNRFYLIRQAFPAPR